jgi:hypothetical protein
MFREVWQKCFSSIGSISYLDKNGIVITSFSGFKAGNYLITDDSVFNIHDAQEVVVKFVESDGVTAAKTLHYSNQDFESKIFTGSMPYTKSFAVVVLKDPEFVKIPALNFKSQDKQALGQPVALMGFQYDQPGLSIKSGIISSYYINSTDSKYIQFDGIVRKGNSGGPLIDTESCQVVGIIGYKLAQMNKAYNQMLDIIKNNIELLKSAEGHLNVGNVDPIQVLIASQNQIKQLSNEIYKFSNQGMGIALDIRHVKEFIEKHQKS